MVFLIKNYQREHLGVFGGSPSDGSAKSGARFRGTPVPADLMQCSSST